MNKSDTTIEISKALVEAQKAMTGAKMDSTNPFFKSKYADLSSVWEACRKPLTDNGLSVAQICDTVEGQSVIETTLLHTSGEWISGRYLLTPVKLDPQSVGSSITYARRYALAAMVGICPEDDDAESTMDRKISSKSVAEIKSLGKAESPMVAKAKEAGAVEKAVDHWCVEHDCKFFKSLKMKAFAHPIAGSAGADGKNLWCYEHTKETEEPTGELKTAGDFLNKCLKEFKLNKAQVEEKIDLKMENLYDFDGAFAFLTDVMQKEKDA